jgi:diguanylate cyclase (GGDEF)-like protein
MRYTGRIVSMLLFLASSASFKINDYLQFGYVPIYEYIYSAIWIYPVWWMGRKYDESKFYFRQLEKAKQLIHESEEKLKELAFHDSLTGVANRRLFKEKVNQSIKEAQRYKRKIAIMYMDIDKFKQINDELGHDVGDELLKQFTQKIRNCIRKSDVLARLGGDEFIILLPEINHPRDSMFVANKILDTLQYPWVIEGHTFITTSSMGIAIYEEGDDYKSLIKRADRALYKAKESGRNTFKISDYSPHEQEG